MDLFKETHCSRKIGFTESVKKAIVSPCFLFFPYPQQSPSDNKHESDMQDRDYSFCQKDMEVIVDEPEHDGQHVKSSSNAVSKVLPQSSKFLQNVGIPSSSKSSTRVGVSSKVQELQAQLEMEKQEKAELWLEMDSLKLQA